MRFEQQPRQIPSLPVKSLGRHRSSERKQEENIQASTSYAQKLVTVISGGVFDLLDPVLERHSFDDLGEVA